MAPAVTSAAASLRVLSKRFLSSASHLPLLFTRRRPAILLSHSLGRLSPTSLCSGRVTPIRCYANPSVGSYSPPPNSGYGLRDPPGCDDESWMIFMDKPGGEGVTEQQMVDFCIQTLAQVVGSEEEAKKKIYRVSSESDFGFGCVIDEETSHKLKGLPGVLRVLPDLFVPDYKYRADELKHLALNIQRFNRCNLANIRGDKAGLSIPNCHQGVQEMRMKQVEGRIEALFASHNALRSEKAHQGVLYQMKRVLNELSIQVRKLWNVHDANEAEQVGWEKKVEEEELMKQVKKALESLSLAREAIASNNSTDRVLASEMATVLKGLSEDVTQLWNLTDREAPGDSGRAP